MRSKKKLAGIVLGSLILIGAIGSSDDSKQESDTTYLVESQSEGINATPSTAQIEQISTPTIVPSITVTQPTSKPTVKPVVKAIETTSAGCKYSCSSPDRDCSDFTSHSEAQTFFNCCGFSATNDPMRLDSARGVGNGLACESL